MALFIDVIALPALLFVEKSNLSIPRVLSLIPISRVRFALPAEPVTVAFDEVSLVKLNENCCPQLSLHENSYQ